ncbi:MAG: 7-cyano-7-deazaguanine synthase, partial [Pseudomonadota bacterium]
DVVGVVTFDYAQHAREKELQCSKALCDRHGLKQYVIPLKFFSEISKSSLNTNEADLPSGDEVSIDDLKASQKSAKSVWVPNRNGVFLNIGAAFAEALGAHVIIPGFNKEEATTFPDNSEDYMKALDQSFSFSTQNQVRVKCYSHAMTKTEIVRDMKSMSVDWNLIWPCYRSGDKHCGECESCKRFYRALGEVGVKPYENSVD